MSLVLTRAYGAYSQEWAVQISANLEDVNLWSANLEDANRHLGRDLSVLPEPGR